MFFVFNIYIYTIYYIIYYINTIYYLLLLINLIHKNLKNYYVNYNLIFLT